eukprot:6126253-Prorocentrum_lima.AAC.1
MLNHPVLKFSQHTWSQEVLARRRMAKRKQTTTGEEQQTRNEKGKRRRKREIEERKNVSAEPKASAKNIRAATSKRVMDLSVVLVVALPVWQQPLKLELAL